MSLPKTLTVCGVEVDDLGRPDLPPLARGFVCVDGGPDFHVSAMDTIESAVEEVERAVVALRRAFEVLP